MTSNVKKKIDKHWNWHIEKFRLNFSKLSSLTERSFKVFPLFCIAQPYFVYIYAWLARVPAHAQHIKKMATFSSRLKVARYGLDTPILSIILQLQQQR